MRLCDILLVIVPLHIFVWPCAGFDVSTTETGGQPVVVYHDVTFKGAKTVTGKLPRSANTLEDCLRYCTQYKGPVRCKGVNYKKPNCMYLDSALTGGKEQIQEYPEGSGYMHACIGQDCDCNPPLLAFPPKIVTPKGRASIEFLSSKAVESHETSRPANPPLSASTAKKPSAAPPPPPPPPPTTKTEGGVTKKAPGTTTPRIPPELSGADDETAMKMVELSPCFNLQVGKRQKADKMGKVVVLKDATSSLGKCVDACRNYVGYRGECKAINYKRSQCSLLTGSTCPTDIANCKLEPEYIHATIKC